jgi:chromosome segregation ATPase
VLRAEARALAAQLVERDGAVADLRNLAAVAPAMRHQLEAAEAEITALGEEAAEARGRCQALQADSEAVTALRLQLEAAEEEITALGEEAAEARALCQALQADAEALTALRATVKAKEDIKTALDQHHADHTADFQEHLAFAASMRSDLEALQRQVARGEADLAASRAQCLTESETHSAVLLAAQGAMRERKEAGAADLAGKQRELEAAVAEKVVVASELDVAREQCAANKEAWAADLAGKQRELEAAVAERVVVASELDVAREQCAALRAAIKTLEEQVDAMSGSDDWHDDELAIARAHLADSQRESAVLRAEVLAETEKLQLQFDEKEAQIGDLTAALAAARAEGQRHKAIASLHQSAEAVDTRLADASRDLLSLAEELDQRISQNAELGGDLARAETANATLEVDLALARAAQGGAPAAVAEAGADAVAEAFALLDRNGDGSLSRAEVIKGLRAQPTVRALLGLGAVVRQEDGTRDAFEAVYQAINPQR